MALITIGAGLIRVSDHSDGRWLTSLVFLTGAVLAAFTAVATMRQVGYQHLARDQARKVAEELGISGLAVASTPGWRDGPNPWWTKVRTVNHGLLAVLGAVNVIGFVYVLVTQR